ncbi:MAG: hypothetical protein HY897_02235 [Deltaproteobacteria bacterium]|nr:hypothetical protein [Deltaproteobacteria bacterium]
MCGMRNYRKAALTALVLGSQILAGGLCERGKTDLAPGQPVTGVISGPGDEVPFEVHLKGGHDYEFTLDPDAGGDSSMFSPRLYIVKKDSQDGPLVETSGMMGGRLTLKYSPRKDIDVYVIVASDGGGFSFTLTMEDVTGGGDDAGAAKDAARDGGLDAGRDAGGPADGGPADGGTADSGEADGSGADAGADAGCSSKSCQTGCCDIYDQCQDGDVNEECGKGGAACEDCTKSKATCQLRQCVGCDSTSCQTGCCDPDGVCRLGNTKDECGKAGADCEDCTSAGKTCDPALRTCTN